MVTNVCFGVLLEFLEQVRLAAQLPGDVVLRLCSLKEEILEFILNYWQLSRLRLLLSPRPGSLLVHRDLEIQVSFTQLLLEVHALWLDKLHLVSLLHDFHHALNILLWKQVIDHLDLPLVIQDVLWRHIVQACSVVYCVEC